MNGFVVVEAYEKIFLKLADVDEFYMENSAYSHFQFSFNHFILIFV